MDPRLLASFVAVAEEGHVGRAADRLRVAQPALSRRLQQLEREMGAPLFLRHSRGLRLSAAGKVLLAEARGILAACARAAELVRDAAAGLSGRLRLGVVDVVAVGGPPMALIRSFRETHPAIALEVRPLISSEQCALLREGSLDLGFVYWLPDDARIAALAVAGDNVALALPVGHPLARRRALALRDLAGEAFIQLPRQRSPIYHDLIRQVAGRDGLRLRVVQEADQESGILGLVAAGLGMSVVVASWRRALPRGVVMRRVAGLDIPLTLHACWRGDQDNPALAAFVEHLRTRAGATLR